MLSLEAIISLLDKKLILGSNLITLSLDELVSETDILESNEFFLILMLDEDCYFVVNNLYMYELGAYMPV